MGIVRVLLLGTLLLSVGLTAVAWRDGRPDYQCGCSCDGDGNQISATDYFERKHADDDRPPLLISAFLAAGLGTAMSLVGVIVTSSRHRFFALVLGGTIGVGVIVVISIVQLAPCLGY